MSGHNVEGKNTDEHLRQPDKIIQTCKLTRQVYLYIKTIYNLLLETYIYIYIYMSSTLL